MFDFTFQDVAREFPQKNRVNLARIHADIVDKGKLCKITRDNYHIIPFNADPERSDENKKSTRNGCPFYYLNNMFLQ